MKPTLALVGPRCAGKSRVGRLLAERLGLSFLDLDDRVAAFGRRAGHASAQAGALLLEVGRARFRALEAAALRSVLEPEVELVLATGGGVVERSENRAWLQRSAEVLWLDAEPATSARRMADDPTLRPALLPGGSPEAELTQLALRRTPLYRALARVRVATDDLEPDAVVRALLTELEPSTFQ